MGVNDESLELDGVCFSVTCAQTLKAFMIFFFWFCQENPVSKRNSRSVWVCLSTEELHLHLHPFSSLKSGV